MSKLNRTEKLFEPNKSNPKSDSGFTFAHYAKAFFPLVAVAVLSVLVFLWLGKHRGYSLEGEIEGFKRITTGPTTLPSVIVITIGATPDETVASEMSEPAQAEIQTSDP